MMIIIDDDDGDDDVEDNNVKLGQVSTKSWSGKVGDRDEINILHSCITLPKNKRKIR